MPIRFKTTLFELKSRGKTDTLLRLPKSVSAKMPSRGMIMIEGTINGATFKTPAEPDGNGSHWFKIKKTLQKSAEAKGGDTVTVVVEPTKDWPEPKVPADLKKILAADKQASFVWQDITPMARWDWIRWIGAGKLAETRTIRINKACSMLKSGKRRPCCFDRSQCTLTEA